MTITADHIVKEAWKGTLRDINSDIFKHSMVKPLPSVWVEANIILPSNTSKMSGPFSYDWTPYWREPVNHLHETSPVRYVSILKSVQCGCTASVVIPGLLYLIAVDPTNMAFTAGDLQLAKKTIEERLDTILRESHLDDLIRPHAVKKGNQRTGDTAASKEFAGGTLTIGGTGSATFFRYWSAQIGFIDDFETAPRDIQGEGGVRSLMDGRQNSYGSSAKTYFISTPNITGTSNINDQYLLGTQKKWNWPCWNCGAFMRMDWSMKLEDGSFAGMIWRLDTKNHLIKESVAFRCPHCGEVTQEKEKYDLNKHGIWISTVTEPVEELHESYSMNAIIQPPGFTGWVALVQKWLAANPFGQKPIVGLLKPFMNLQLGLPFEEFGKEVNVSKLMENTRKYLPGVIPDKTCRDDGNGEIIMITMSCDLNGLVDDARLDWEILAHSQTGATYSINHGSIGTFMRTRDKNAADKLEDETRMKWTYSHNSVTIYDGNRVNNSVWNELEEVIKAIYPAEADTDGRDIKITVIDTGFFEKLVMEFIVRMQDEGYFVYGVKGRVERPYRLLLKDTKSVVRSSEKPKQLYIIEVDQIKDELSQFMDLREGEDGASQPGGFMNYPEPNDGKYTMNDYFKHYEGERRTEVKEKGNPEKIIGYKWEKKHSMSQNHFWDVRVYNLAAPLVYLDLVRQSDPKYKLYSWEDFVAELVNN